MLEWSQQIVSTDWDSKNCWFVSCIRLYWDSENADNDGDNGDNDDDGDDDGDIDGNDGDNEPDIHVWNDWFIRK